LCRTVIRFFAHTTRVLCHAVSGDGQSAIPTIPEVDENLDYDDGLIRSTDP